MSANCTKDLEITIGLPLSLLSYWKFDEATGTRNDSHGSNNLTETALAVPSQAGIIANATLCNSQINQTLDNSSPSTLWIYESGITVAGWLFINGNMTLSAGPFLSCPHDNGSIVISPSSFPSNLLHFVAAFNAPPENVAVNMNHVVGSFFFFRFWIDPSDGRVRVKINEGATSVSSVAFSGPVSIGNGTLIRFSRPTDGFVNYNTGHDEIGIWRGVMTDAQGAFLYNGGAGRTYPDVPGI